MGGLEELRRMMGAPFSQHCLPMPGSSSTSYMPALTAPSPWKSWVSLRHGEAAEHRGKALQRQGQLWKTIRRLIPTSMDPARTDASCKDAPDTPMPYDRWRTSFGASCTLPKVVRHLRSSNPPPPLCWATESRQSRTSAWRSPPRMTACLKH